ncbi:hypothetical protein T4B_6992 [Trichinella pseudospiralis]|uniref:Uncharacterized protein n=1 Tax=Trichinella pseudospiralis TaxID=6337 RepID=A0A0V1J9Y9_TRIPS|nr:hypothetical protein T4B_6992 [Trichinella pseudospiralis]KRZ32242.1 hypothetical protein T4C_13129 [Trichinella pseudospiralis]KRZ32263.1 hypothetical protein T4C_2191 [Trichinella pseudospiralis]
MKNLHILRNTVFEVCNVVLLSFFKMRKFCLKSKICCDKRFGILFELLLIKLSNFHFSNGKWLVCQFAHFRLVLVALGSFYCVI